MKHTITVSKCCGSENWEYKTKHFAGQEPDHLAYCNNCKKFCLVETITLTPDSEIAEVFREEMKVSNGVGIEISDILQIVAQKLKVEL